jgi:hypothetical protein
MELQACGGANSMKKFLLAGTIFASAISAHAECLGHVHYMDEGVRKAETFVITAMRANKKTGAKLFGGHGTNWYAPGEIKINGHCRYAPEHYIDSEGDEYFSSR